jgi:hypothetical protein
VAMKTTFPMGQIARPFDVTHGVLRTVSDARVPVQADHWFRSKPIAERGGSRGRRARSGTARGGVPRRRADLRLRAGASLGLRWLSVIPWGSRCNTAEGGPPPPVCDACWVSGAWGLRGFRWVAGCSPAEPAPVCSGGPGRPCAFRGILTASVPEILARPGGYVGMPVRQ